jgi:hypothetical protein
MSFFSLSTAVPARVVPGTSISPCRRLDVGEIRNVGHRSEIVDGVMSEISN